MRRNIKGFSLIEALISVGLLALVSLVSLSMVTNIVRSSVKVQAGTDIEQASDFVLLKLENDIKKSYFASVENSGQTLVLTQGSPAAPTQKSYALASSALSLGGVSLTDPASVLIDTTVSNFTLVEKDGTPLAVNLTIRFLKSAVSGTKVFSGESTLETTVVLRGAY